MARRSTFKKATIVCAHCTNGHLGQRRAPFDPRQTSLALSGISQTAHQAKIDGEFKSVKVFCCDPANQDDSKNS